MTTYTFIGAALANYKTVQVAPGLNAGPSAVISIGLGPYQITQTGWNATTLAQLWNASTNPLFQQITASAVGNNLVLTCDVQGQDFEITTSVNGQVSGLVASTLMTLSLLATGGTFTLSDGTYTTSAISYSSVHATQVSNIQAAINALTGYGTTDVVVSYLASSGTYQLDFSQGRFVGLNVTSWIVNGSNLTGGTADAVITETQRGNVGTNENITVSFPAAGTHTENIDTIQTITMGATGSPTGGTFTLTIPSFGTTAAIAFNAGRSAVKTAIEALVGFFNTTVTGGPLANPVVGTTAWTSIAYPSTPFFYYYNSTQSAGTALSNGNTLTPMQSGATSYTNLQLITNFTIPQGATLNDLVSVINAYNPTGSAFNLTMQAVKQANPSMPSTVGAAQALPLTTASASVTIPAGTTQNAPISIDLTNVIQEVVNQGGWASGNNILFVVTGGPNTATAAAWNGTRGQTQPQASLNGTYVGGTTYTYTPVVVEFTGTLAGTAVGQMTVNSSLTGGTASVALTQAGGSQTVNNINGGTWALQLVDPTTSNVYNINGIPYNVTHAALQTLINSVCGAGSATVTGGPAPGTPLVIAFTGGMGNRTLNESVISSLRGNFGSSSQITTVRSAVAAPTPQNVWDMTVVPGEGTLAVASGAPLTTLGYIILTIIEPSTTDPAYYINNSVYIPLFGINPNQIENAINESLGSEAVRVTRVVHSLEQGVIPANQVGGSISAAAQDLHFWYYRDVFRLSFCGAYAAAASISGISVSYPIVSGGNPVPAGPLQWMTGSGPGSGTEPPVTSDALDFYPESERTYLGFTNYYQEANTSNQPSGNNQGPKFDVLSIVYNASVTCPYLCYRAKLFNQYPPGLVSPPAANKIGTAVTRAGHAQTNSNLITFSWVQYSAILPMVDVSTGYHTFVSTSPLPWDASPDEIQAALVPIFGAGNVLVTGSLYNSWLSETQIDSSDPQTTYNDLRIYLYGNLKGLPLSDLGYGLQATITTTSEAVTPVLWIEEYAKALPGGVNNRQRFTLQNAASVSSLTLTINNTTVTGLTPATTADQLQALINSTFGTLPLGNFPDKASQAAVVYGTTLAAPLEIEFTGMGLQFANQTMNFGVQNDAVTITLVRNTAGSYPISEIQTLTITGSPHGGTYTVHGSGNIAYNAIASVIQTAIGSAPPTVAGTYPNFTITWPSASGPQTLWTTTQALNNSAAVLNVTQAGGPGAATGVSDLITGTGSAYYDCPNNYSPIGVPGAGDTLVINDATVPINFGLAQVTQFVVNSLTPGTFQFSRNRKVYVNNQKVVLYGTGTAPSGLTFGTTYYVINVTANYTFQLAATANGAPIVITTTGVGALYLTNKGIIFNLYSLYTGGLIGLPNINENANIPEYLAKYLQLDGVIAQIGLGVGDGLANLRLDTWNDPATINIVSTGQSNITNIPSVLLLANNAATSLTIENGDVACSFYPNESSVFGAITIYGGDLALNNVTANILTGGQGVPITETNCNIADVVSLG